MRFHNGKVQLFFVRCPKPDNAMNYVSQKELTKHNNFQSDMEHTTSNTYNYQMIHGIQINKNK